MIVHDRSQPWAYGQQAVRVLAHRRGEVWHSSMADTAPFVDFCGSPVRSSAAHPTAAGTMHGSEDTPAA